MSEINTGFDLGELNSQTEEIAELAIRHPATGLDTGMKIQLYSVDSEAWQKTIMRLRKENLRYRDRREGTPQDKLQDDSLELLAACAAGWSGVLENGQPLPFTKANAKRVFKEFPFIREQVDEFIGDRRNFIRS